MRITFMVSGGFVGGVKGCRIDTASLDDDGERLELERLVATSGIIGTVERSAAVGRDLREYHLAIERAAGTSHLVCDERSVPDEARPLVAFLTARATPQPPAFALPAVGTAADSGEDRWGRFVGAVVARWLDDGRQMQLVEPFAYVDPRELRWEAGAGAIVDGASIPRAFWSLIGGPFEGRFRDASVVHDVACEERTRPWEDVHRMFYEACRCGGVAVVKAKTMYYAVQHFGPRWRIEERRTIVAGRPHLERVVHDETPPPPTEAEAAAVERYFAAHEVAAAEIPALRIGGAE